jgi:hypothetical protein
MNRSLSKIVIRVVILALLVSILPGPAINAQITTPENEGYWQLVDTEEVIPADETIGDEKDNRKYTLSYSNGSFSCDYKWTQYDGIKKENKYEILQTTGGWTQPPESILPDDKVSLTLSAAIGKFQRINMNYSGIQVKAYIASPDTPFGRLNAGPGDLTDENGKNICEASIVDGKIKVDSQTKEVTGIFGKGTSDGEKKALFVVARTDRLGGVKYIYEWKAAKPSPSPSAASASSSAVLPTEAPIDRTLTLQGTVTDAYDVGLPYAYITVKPSFGSETYVTSTGLNGAYLQKINIPGSQSGIISIDISVELRCRLDKTAEFASSSSDDKTAYRLVEVPVNNTVSITTRIMLDLSDEKYRGVKDITVLRKINFATAPSNYASRDENGVNEFFITSVSDRAHLPGYSYIYRCAFNAIHFSVKKLKDRTLLRKYAVSPLTIELNSSKDSSCYSGSRNTVYMKIIDCGADDMSRYTIYHEMGHAFEYETNGGKHRCSWSTQLSTANPNHGGYLNSSTADSFIEGFATWFAVQVQKYGLYTETNPYIIGSFGNIDGNWKVWKENGIREEFAIAQALCQFERLIPIKLLWEDILRPDRSNFYEYYLVLVNDVFLSGFDHIESDSEFKEKIDRICLDRGIYTIPRELGNRRWDFYAEGKYEPFRDVVIKNNTRDAREPFADLHIDPATRRISAGFNPDTAIIGASSDASRSRRSTFLSPNSYLQLKGAHIDSVRIVFKPDGESPWAYLAPVTHDGKVYIGLPGEESYGSVEALLPDGKVFWNARIEELQERFDRTMLMDSVLDSATVPQYSIPEGAVVLPAGGSDDTGHFIHINLENSEPESNNAIEDIFSKEEDASGAVETLSKAYCDMKSVLIPFAFAAAALVVLIISIIFLRRKKKKPADEADTYHRGQPEKSDLKQYAPKFCKNCGAKLEAGTKYCRECGRKLE